MRIALARVSVPLLALMILAQGVMAQDSWDDIRVALYEDRPLRDGQEVIAIDAPRRTENDARTQIAAFVAAPQNMSIGKVTVVLDENPMPVSAVFALDVPQPQFFFDLTMRINGPTPLHVIAETTDGQLWVAESYVKTSGQGACAAPPGTNPEEALLTLGQMDIQVANEFGASGGALTKLAASGFTARHNKMELDIDHPSHSGMQRDQISLLYIPMRYVEDVEIALDGAGYVDLTGSISLSENPRVGISVPSKTRQVDVTMTDTDGTVATKTKKLAGY